MRAWSGLRRLLLIFCTSCTQSKSWYILIIKGTFSSFSMFRKAIPINQFWPKDEYFLDFNSKITSKNLFNMVIKSNVFMILVTSVFCLEMKEKVEKGIPEFFENLSFSYKRHTGKACLMHSWSMQTSYCSNSWYQKSKLWNFLLTLIWSYSDI